MRCRGTSLIRERPSLGPYGRAMPRVRGGPGGGAVSYERGTPVVHGALVFARSIMLKDPPPTFFNRNR